MTQTMFQFADELREKKRIDLGYFPDNINNFYFYDFFDGDAYLIAGMTSYGKTLLAGNIAVELAESRPLLIFDYNSKGHYKNLKYINWQNKNHIYKCIPDLTYIPKFGFKIEDFTNPFDWAMMGMNEKAAAICASKASQTLYHKNDFEKFRDMIFEIPVFSKAKKGDIWWQTRDSIISMLNSVKSIFIKGECVDVTYKDFNEVSYTGIPFYVSDWNYFLSRHPHLVVNMDADNNPAKAQLFVGKILNDARVTISRMRHAIILEEAHHLCPAEYYNSIPYSMVVILKYLKDLHKEGVKLILISQYPSQMQREVLDEAKRLFIGKLQNIGGYSHLDEIFRMSLKLNNNYIQGYREFLHYSAIYNEKDIFVPYDSFTFYEKRR